MWELQSQSLAQITLLGSVQLPFTTLLTVHLLVELVPLYNSSRKSLITFSFLIFYTFAIFEIQPRQNHLYQVHAIDQMSNW